MTTKPIKLIGQSFILVEERETDDAARYLNVRSGAVNTTPCITEAGGGGGQNSNAGYHRHLIIKVFKTGFVESFKNLRLVKNQ